MRLSESGKIDDAINHLKWAVEKFEIQRDFLQKMKTPDDKWKSAINNLLIFSDDNTDVVDMFEDEIKDLESNKYNMSKEMQQEYIVTLASPEFEMQSFRENMITLFIKVQCQ